MPGIFGNDNSFNNVLIAYVYLVIIPYIVVFILALALSLYIFSRKGRRFYVKSLFNRLLASVIISLAFDSMAIWFVMFLHTKGIDIKYPF
jgi:ABC-type sugar transport system permease subunit